MTPQYMQIGGNYQKSPRIERLALLEKFPTKVLRPFIKILRFCLTVVVAALHLDHGQTWTAAER